VEWECSCESSIITGDGWSWSDGGVFLFYPQGFAAINRFLTASGGMRVENLSSCCKNLLGGLAYAKLNAFGLTRWARRAGDPSLRLKAAPIRMTPLKISFGISLCVRFGYFCN
jgi:hypothetical protein